MDFFNKIKNIIKKPKEPTPQELGYSVYTIEGDLSYDTYESQDRDALVTTKHTHDNKYLVYFKEGEIICKRKSVITTETRVQNDYYYLRDSDDRYNHYDKEGTKVEVTDYDVFSATEYGSIISEYEESFLNQICCSILAGKPIKETMQKMPYTFFTSNVEKSINEILRRNFKIYYDKKISEGLTHEQALKYVQNAFKEPKELLKQKRNKYIIVNHNNTMAQIREREQRDKLKREEQNKNKMLNDEYDKI